MRALIKEDRISHIFVSVKKMVADVWKKFKCGGLNQNMVVY
jgi:hypothetical protein